MSEPSEIYTREWYDDVRRTLGHEYVALARIIDDAFAPYQTVIDVGCGSGLILEELTRRGRSTFGLDGSEHAIASAADSVRARIELWDLRRGPPDHGTYDLVICTEVAEHLDAEHADSLVRTCVALARGPIFFTAATPGQGGTDHRNEQPAKYWLDRFATLGYRASWVASNGIRVACGVNLAGMHWFATNSLVLVPR